MQEIKLNPISDISLRAVVDEEKIYFEDKLFLNEKFSIDIDLFADFISKYTMNAAQLADRTGLTDKRIHQFKNELIRLNMAHIQGKRPIFHYPAIKYIKNRPEKRGRKKKLIAKEH